MPFDAIMSETLPSVIYERAFPGNRVSRLCHFCFEQEDGMHLLKKVIIPLCILIPTATTALAQGKDVEGSQDHQLVSRYPGAIIDKYQFAEFDEVSLPLGKSNDGKPEKSQRLEGKVTHISYAIPAGRSILEVYRNYEGALRKGGFQILFNCVNNTAAAAVVRRYGHPPAMKTGVGARANGTFRPSWPGPQGMYM
jgi:hypothetical protein